MAKKTSRPGRTLLIFFLCVAALYGFAALGKTWKPQLGLDLAGGTRITLQATNKSLSADKLKEAKNIIESRVNGNGVTEAEVTTQGSRNIIVEIPGKNRKNLVDSVKRTAQLRFRLVAGVIEAQPPATSTPTATPSGTATPKPSSTPTTSPTAKATATPKGRSAPNVDVRAADTPSPTPTPAATPTKPLELPTTPTASGNCAGIPTDAASTKGKSKVDLLLAWQDSAPVGCQQDIATFACPKKGTAPAALADDPDRPLITCDAAGNKYLLSQALILGTQLKSASAFPPQGNVTQWGVQLKLRGGQPTKDFAAVSRVLVNNGKRFAIVLDGQVLSAPGFDGVIPDGTAQITGSFNQESATSLANSLKYGALPVKFDQNVTTETVGATLAGNQLDAGILAGIIGLLIVMIYCLLYYRGLGLVVIASLVIAAAVTYAVVLILAKAAGFALTLPGIAGLIVAVGITADSFIVYFERIRDEMRDGKSMRVAVEAGWVRARNTTLAADAVSFLAAVVLYIFAIGVVRGFAFALGISTIIDVAVFFFFTKPMVTLLAKQKFFNGGHRFSGLSSETLGMDEPVTAPSRLVGGKA
ncbi:MAG: protein translocase subunit SecD [Nocardioidaceae bacterium]|nr:protein translocase subunit SecD [Nocardioidaceae bacterium]